MNLFNFRRSMSADLCDAYLAMMDFTRSCDSLALKLLVSTLHLQAIQHSCTKDNGCPVLQALDEMVENNPFNPQLPSPSINKPDTDQP